MTTTESNEQDEDGIILLDKIFEKIVDYIGKNLIQPLSNENKDLHRKLSEYEQKITCLKNEIERQVAKQERIQQEMDLYEAKATYWKTRATGISTRKTISL